VPKTKLLEKIKLVLQLIVSQEIKFFPNSKIFETFSFSLLVLAQRDSKKN